ncbi:chromosome segregation protein SMC [Selenomonas sp. oral taxon 149]|uniref:chromosome segregation protein SMC n=1 Tax=Selenomonas sp. oral taxon 149 TaxID=712535 RepID=UPI0001E0BED2|nr:chromosome segregation protein SMC [Selenomonas sp. oral taxon 149]EFM24207.1 chromosome segregation protein SMC [Selenomonas sp. oral taxon 149 str. 67H29BP]
MQLKRLEAYGFKSFAERIVVQFDQGITAVVGPNGSGKSNITDAVRWVLGEQNIRMLRGLRAEDIIFAGSSARRALSVAEVILVFDNTDKTLPIDYEEVVVKRRLYRNGDSEIYLNDSRCRIKDIYQLFADTGIGHDGMSIIGQNRLNDILDSRPEDRRVFFDETAGITKYRTRKQEALRKLRDNDTDLVRLSDIMHAQATELQPLSQQAEKTKQFRGLDSERRSYQLTALVHQHESLQKEQESADRDLHVHEEAEIRAMQERKEKEDQKTALEEKMAAIDLRMGEQEQKSTELQSKLDHLTREAALLEGRRDEGEKRKAYIEQQRQSAEVKIQTTLQEIAQIDALLVRKREECTGKEHALHEACAELERVQALVHTEEKEQERNAHARHAVQRVLARLREKLAAVSGAHQDSDHAASAQEELARRRSLLIETQSEITAAEDAARRIEEELCGGKEKCSRIQQEMEELRRAQENDERQIRQTEGEMLRAQQSLEFLRRMQESYEGFGKDVQIVLRAQEPWRSHVAGTVADLIRIPQRFLAAMEAALGGSVRNIVTEDAQTAKEAIGYLKRNHGGRVTFLPLTTITVRPPRDIDTKQHKGIIGWANTLVQADGRFQRVVDHLLGQTLVMETLDDALVTAKKEGYRLRIVTLTGELLNPGGSLSGGGRRKQQTMLLNRHAEIETTEANLAAKSKLCGEYRAAREAHQNAWQIKDRDVQRCTKRIEQLSGELLKNNGNRELLQARALDHAEAVQKMEHAEQERAIYSAQLAKKRVQLERHIAQCEAHESRFIHEQEKLNQAGREYGAALKKTADAIHALEVELASLRTSIDTEEMHRKSRVLEEQDARKTQSDITAQEKQLSEELTEGTARIASLSEEISAQEKLLRESRKNSSDLRDARLAHEADVRVLDEALKKCLLNLEEIRSKRHECDKLVERIQLRMEDCRERLLSDFGLTPESASVQAKHAEPQVVSAYLHELESAIQSLGTVNPNAIEEYEEKKARYEEEERQVEDLKSAKQDIEQIIQKIDQDMTRTFREAFRQIQEYFNKIFVRLFGGGIAELRLTDKEDILNSGVEILVTLPDKKRQNLSALSGGERALTVIALLFSFLRYRPSPFSILDEIDAPLDEANVLRFGDFLQEFAKHTQFIVVTHRKGTMRAADTMYGVTVEDAGVSKVLSIRLKDYEAEQSA